MPPRRLRKLPGVGLGRQLEELLHSGGAPTARGRPKGSADPPGRRLRTLFDVFNRRHVFEVRLGGGAEGACVEVCVDRVGFEAGRRRQTADEVELEAIRGGPEVLTGLAERLAGRLGLLGASRSKFARGLDLAGLHPPVEPSAVLEGEQFGPTDRTIDVAYKVLGVQLARLAWHEPGTRMGLDPEYCHQIRVATRRARAALRLFSAALGARTAESLRRRLRTVADALGRVRDLDVYLENLPSYSAHMVNQANGSETIQRYRAHLDAQRDQARTELMKVLDSRAYAALVERMQSLTADGPPVSVRRPAALMPIARFARLAVGKGLKCVLKQGRSAGPDAPDARLHQLRLSIKRLRYTCEFLWVLPGKPGRRFVRRLTRMQDALGRFQDAIVATGLLERFAGTIRGDEEGAAAVLLDLGQLIGWQRSRQIEERAEFARLWQRFDRGKVRTPILKALRAS